jgi:hypothetical protein
VVESIDNHLEIAKKKKCLTSCNIILQLLVHMSNKECQRDEICALESIYNEEEIQTCEENGLLGGQFYAYIDLPTGFKVVFRNLLKKG